MVDLCVQLERLNRHYATAIRTYDQVSLLDLAHSLRIWVELKATLVKESAVVQAQSFKTAAPTKRTTQALKDVFFLLAYMPGGAETFASNGQLFSGPDFNKGGSFSIGGKIRRDDGSKLTLFDMYAVGWARDEGTGSDRDYSVKRCNFVEWLGAEAVRVNYFANAETLERHMISRELLIKRVANVLGGSHALPDDSSEKTNRFDAPIAFLMKFGCGGLPLPYFLLLKMAQDILKNMPRLVRTKNGV